MTTLHVQEKDIVIPGEALAQGMEYLPSAGTYREGDTIYAARLGVVRLEGKVIKALPVSGRYLPKIGDVIICKVEEILMSGWRVETNSAYSAVLPLKDATSEFIERGADLTKYFDIDDHIMAQVTNVTSQNLIDITMRSPGLRKILGGRILLVSPHKVPRIIGKGGSMVSMIKQNTGCQLLVGQNGCVWIKSDNADAELLSVRAVKMIEEQAHISGLTDRVKDFLEKEIARMGLVVEKRDVDQDDAQEGGSTFGSSEGGESRDGQDGRDRERREFRPREGGRSFGGRPHGDRPHGDRPREGGFRPREGGFRPREGGDRSPRPQRDFRPRESAPGPRQE